MGDNECVSERVVHKSTSCPELWLSLFACVERRWVHAYFVLFGCDCVCGRHLMFSFVCETVFGMCVTEFCSGIFAGFLSEPGMNLPV